MLDRSSFWLGAHHTTEPLVCCLIVNFEIWTKKRHEINDTQKNHIRRSYARVMRAGGAHAAAEMACTSFFLLLPDAQVFMLDYLIAFTFTLLPS